MDVEDRKEISEEDMKQNAENVSEKTENQKDLIESYKDLLEKENREKEETGTSTVDQLREVVENWGMQFSRSTFRDSVFVINPNVKGTDKKEYKKNILGTMDDQEILEWCSEHYKDYIFAVFLSVCILDCQAYEDILQMGNELHNILDKKKDEESENVDFWNYKSRIQETLGVIEYRDKVYVRGTEQETDFLRLPLHEQSSYYIRLLVKEFAGLKLMLGPYLASKIFETCKSKKNYLIVGGCTEALANIGNQDVVFFNSRILPLFLGKRTDEADYCLAMLLNQMYLLNQNRDYVITCAEQWGRIKNNPHYPLTALYLCGMVKNQEGFVCGVWNSLLSILIKEIIDGLIFADNSYYVNLLEFFRSGNRELSYYKGVIHAFYNKIKKMEKENKRKECDILGTLFLLLVMNDYGDCDLSGLTKRRKDMLLVEIMEQMDEKTGHELVFLWKQVLKHRKHPGEGWNILRRYLDKYESWSEKDLRKLAFFFYWINRELGDDQAYSFLNRSMLKGGNRLLIAEKIYEKIIGENSHGRQNYRD